MSAAPLSVAVGGGKGGVGKSVVATNLAAAMANLGFRVVLIDADLGAANLHTLLGVDRPGLTLQALLDRKVLSLEEVVIPTIVPRLFMVPGIGAVAGAANLPHAQKVKLLRHVQEIDADALVIDCGAGTGHNVVDFFTIADVRVVVATPQLTSLQNAYAFLKAAVYRTLQSEAANHRERQALKLSSDRSETERVSDLLRRVVEEDPSLAVRLTNCLESFGAFVVGNQLEHPGQENIIHALSRMVSDFLNVGMTVIDHIPRSDALHRSVSRRQPLVATSPHAHESRTFFAVAEKLLTTNVGALRAQRAQLNEPVSEPPDTEGLPGPIGRYLRRHERYNVNWVGSAEINGHWTVARVYDVSKGGLLIRTERRLTKGLEVSVHIGEPAHVALRGIVRHIDGERAGIELHEEDSARYGDALVAAVHGQPARRSA